MTITKMSLPRRTVLRGLGASVALPLLDAMVPAASALSRTAAAPTPRFGVVYVPNGIAMEYWTPAEEGKAFGLTPILHPLEPFKDQLTVVSGLRGYWTPAHAGASTTFLTGAAGVAGETAPVAGISMDQLLAREYGRHTELGSLQLAIDSRANAGQCSGNHSCVYTNTICWRSRTTPLPMENNPRVVFEQMFGDSGSTDPRGPPRPHGARPLDSRLGHREGRRPQARGRPPPTASRSTSTLRGRARHRAPHRAGRAAAGLRPARPGPARGHPRHVRRARRADVRPAGAGPPDRPHPRDLVHAGPRGQLEDLYRDRHPRRAPPALAPRVQAGEDRVDVQDQRVPRVDVRRLPRQAPLDAGRRRLAARQHAAPLRLRHVRQQRAQPPRSAGPPARRVRGGNSKATATSATRATR